MLQSILIIVLSLIYILCDLTDRIAVILYELSEYYKDNKYIHIIRIRLIIRGSTYSLLVLIMNIIFLTIKSI